MFPPHIRVAPSARDPAPHHRISVGSGLLHLHCEGDVPVDPVLNAAADTERLGVLGAALSRARAHAHNRASLEGGILGGMAVVVPCRCITGEMVIK